jgi:L-fucose isomerase-like protein
MTVKINSPVKEFLERICNHGIGHHLNVAYSHFITELRYLAKLSGINIIIEK